MRGVGMKLVLVVLGVLLLAGCSERVAPTKEESGVLIYATLNPVTEELTESVEEYNQSHSDVKIEIRDYSDEKGVERLLYYQRASRT